ncbi:MAG: hypothetical protein Kow0029_09790 [Candidatus Rifleibacteriota bacterium]
MIKRRKESGAFWAFLLWMLFVPLFLNSGLSAEEENIDDFMVQEEPLPDDNKAADEKQRVAANAAVEEDSQADEATAGDEDLPALSADPNELISKVNGDYRGKKYDNVLKKLQDHEDVLEESKELSEMYVDSLINSKKPDWNKVNRAAKVLLRLDGKSSLGNYATGLYYQNKSKPDLGKAISYFSKAKSAKKPHPDAAMAYYMALLKKFWMALVGVVLLPVIIVANKIKKKKAAAANVEINLDGEAVPAGEEDLQSKLQAAIADGAGLSEQTGPGSSSAESATASQEKAAGKPHVSGQPAPAVTPAPATVSPAVHPAPAKDAGASPVLPPASSTVAAASQQKAAEKPQVSGQPVSAVTPAPAQISPEAPELSQAQKNPQPITPAPDPSSQVPVQPASVAPSDMNQRPQAAPYYPNHQLEQTLAYHSLAAKRAAEIEQAREMISPQRREPVSADPELEAIWSKLCRKALKSKIPVYAKSDRADENTGFSGPKFSPESYSAPNDNSNIDYNVTIDLSEEALRDDLVGKLKMLAIDDGELRELLAQKNPAHIPHLIEYVLSKPEPLRLALVARELGYYDDPAVIDTLASLLYHEDNRVALAAIQGLEKSKNPQAILLLCPFLKSDIPLLAQAARSALSNFGAVKILKAFISLPQNPDEKIREAGVFVLSRMKGKQVEQLLVQMLNDDSEVIREKVILAMSYQKNPAYIDALREFFRIASGKDKTLARKAIVYLQGFVSSKKP